MKRGIRGVSLLGMLAPFLFLSSLFSKAEVFDPKGCVTVAQHALCKDKNIIDALFFTPDESGMVKCVLIGLIESEKKVIKAALFRLTDKDITQALLRAKARGVAIELVVDSGALALSYFSKVHLLGSQGVPVYVYQSKAMNGAFLYKSIMHQKTFIFENCLGTSVVVFGSLNPTQSAFQGNEEVVQIRNSAVLLKRFKDNFEKLKERSCCYEMKEQKKIAKSKEKQKTKKAKIIGASLPRFPLSRDQIYSII